MDSMPEINAGNARGGMPHGDEQHLGQDRRRMLRYRSKPKLQPPLTPMIDVTFQLLIFFLLTTTFRAEEGQIPGSLPQVGGIAAVAEVQLEPLVIQIKPFGSDRSRCRYEVTGRPLPLETPSQLYQVLRARREEMGENEPVILRPTPNVPWYFVVEAFNQAVRAEYTNIGYAAT
jgi:biopolymer transport protein ExbD